MKRRLRRLEAAFQSWHQINRETHTKISMLKAMQAMRLARVHWKRLVGLFDVGHIDMAEIERIIGP